MSRQDRYIWKSGAVFSTRDNEDTKKTAFLRARKFLVNQGFVEVTDDIYSIRDRGT